jgi:hypothetical protein
LIAAAVIGIDLLPFYLETELLAHYFDSYGLRYTYQDMMIMRFFNQFTALTSGVIHFLSRQTLTINFGRQMTSGLMPKQ